MYYEYISSNNLYIFQLLFCLPQLSYGFLENIFPYIVPYALPLAQIALTGKLPQ